MTAPVASRSTTITCSEFSHLDTVQASKATVSLRPSPSTSVTIACLMVTVEELDVTLPLRNRCRPSAQREFDQLSRVSVCSPSFASEKDASGPGGGGVVGATVVGAGIVGRLAEGVAVVAGVAGLQATRPGRR